MAYNCGFHRANERYRPLSEVIAEADCDYIAVYAYFFIAVAVFCQWCEAYASAKTDVIVFGKSETKAEAPHGIYSFPPVFHHIYGFVGNWLGGREVRVERLRGVYVEINPWTGIDVYGP